MKVYTTFLLLTLLIRFGFPTMLYAAPANDSFATPTVITGISATVTSSNIDATLQINEQLPDAPGSTTAQSSQASVWFTWTAPITGAVQIDTLGSDFDTIVAVWTGSNLTTLSEIASNDEYDSPQSAVFIDVVMGVTYRIAIYGYFDDRGAITLNIANDTTSRISGTVTGPNGTTPLPGLYVLAHRQVGDEQFAYWGPLAYTTTGVDGTYTIRGLNSNTYRVEFSDFDDGDYVAEHYNNAPDVNSAVDIIVAPTTTVTAINASLALASKISGIVTGPDGITPLVGIGVIAYRLNSNPPYNYWESIKYASTEADGSYQLGGLAGGTYRVGFDTFEGNYVPEYYANSMNVNSATDITVASASTVTSINASLAPASKILGTVTGPDGTTPLASAVVTIYELSDSLPSSSWNFVKNTSTQANGSYQFNGLTAGTYRVGFSDPSGDYLPEFYNNAVTLNSALNITVPEITIVTGINASLMTSVSPKITGFRKLGSIWYEISFIGNVGQRYQLQEAVSLIGWADVGTPITCLAGLNIHTVMSSSPKKFWRIRTLP